MGVSAHNAAEALAAQADGADYLGCGAAFVTGTKLDAHPVTAETMRAVTAAVNIPVVAIGGIDAANLLQLQGRGLAGVAVVSAIFAQADPCAASRELYRDVYKRQTSACSAAPTAPMHSRPIWLISEKVWLSRLGRQICSV